MTRFSATRIEAGQVFDTLAEPSTLYYIISGNVAVEVNTINGSNTAIIHLKAGDIVNIEAWFSGVVHVNNGIRSTLKVAETECTVIPISIARLKTLLKGPYRAQEDFILSFLMQGLLSLTTAMVSRISSLAQLRAEDRVLAALYELVPNEKKGEEVKIKIPRERLAKLANCSRLTAGSCIDKLVEQGALKKKGHSLILTVLDAA